MGKPSGVSLKKFREKQGKKLADFCALFQQGFKEFIVWDDSANRSVPTEIKSVEIRDIVAQFANAGYSPGDPIGSGKTKLNKDGRLPNAQKLNGSDKILPSTRNSAQIIYDAMMALDSGGAGNNEVLDSGRGPKTVILNVGPFTVNRKSTIDWNQLLNTPDFGGQYIHGEDNETAGGGIKTELFSEILAMYCLGHSMASATPLTRDNFADGRDLDSAYQDVEKKLHTVASQFSFSKLQDRENLVTFGTTKAKVGSNLWVDVGIAQAALIQSKINITNKHEIYNDKLFGAGTLNYDPYMIYVKAKMTGQNDKWNPADMWIINAEGKQKLIEFNNQHKDTPSIIALNDFLVDQWDNENIYPISLKKLRPPGRWTLVNSNHYIDRINIDTQNEPAVIEFTEVGEGGRSNQDVKINFVLEKVKLNSGLTTRQAQEQIFGNIGTVESSQRIRLKYKVSTKGMDVEFAQSKDAKGEASNTAEAKQGAIGYKIYNDLIMKTSMDGVSQLESIKDTHRKDSPTENDPSTLPLQRASGAVFTSHGVPINNANVHLAENYLVDIWKDINGQTSEMSDGFSLRMRTNPDSMKNKIISGEIGVSIQNIPNTKVKKRVIQNLYNACASVGLISGITDDDSPGLSVPDEQRMRIEYIGGIHGKVY